MGAKQIIGRVALIGFIIIAIPGVVILLLYGTNLSYAYCLARDGAWLKAKDQKQLERSLFAFYTKKDIRPAQSMWGKYHTLKPNQHMTQYLIFGKEPLDVVFFSDGTIDTIYTSYE